MRMLTTAAMLVCCSCALAQAEPRVECKDIGAPPSDISTGVVRLPAHEDCATRSCSAMLFSDELTEAHTSFMPGPGKAGVVLFGPEAAFWALDGAYEASEQAERSQMVRADPLTPGADARAIAVQRKGERFTFELEQDIAQDRCAVLIADGAESAVLSTWLGTHTCTPGEPVPLVMQTEGCVPLEISVVLTSPDGNASTLKVERPAARSSLNLVPEAEGDWTIRTIAKVRDHAGAIRYRTTQQVMRVRESTITFNGEARIEAGAAGKHRVVIPVTSTGHNAKLIVGAEVWGIDEAGVEKPVCWIARMQRVNAEDQLAVLEIGMADGWIGLAGVHPKSLFLREVRAQEANGAALIAHRERMPMAIEGEMKPTAHDGITKTMLASHSGVSVAGAMDAPARGSSRSLAGHVLLLSHGYCAGGMPFTVSDFSGDVEQFLDIDQNRSHDEFALLFEARGRAFKSMGLVVHSQGGNGAAHLYTFYWSALDWAQGARLIQCVGTPWQGTPLAGNAAVLGEIFGAGCGSNFDLTAQGAQLWLSTIPTSTRQQIRYWTTAFEDRPFSFDFCQFATDFLLSDPEDGVVENSAGQLPGASNGGLLEGWCHTRDMRDPPQCEDPNRNAEMNQEAAR